jgi:LruC domain-containing protein
MISIRKKQFILLTLVLLFIGSSCKKELTQNEQASAPIESMNDLVVEESFDFTTSQTIDIKIVAEDFKGLPATKIDIYNANPNEGGLIIKSGITNKEQEFSTIVTLPADQQTIHIRRTTYNGTIETVTMDITSADLEYTFSSKSGYGSFKGNVDGPGCTDCTTTINNHQSGNLSINSGEVVCILSGASFTGGLNMNGGTLKVCGSLTVQWINGDGMIIVNDDGAFIANNLNMNDSDLTVENYSDAFMVGAGPNIKGTFKNYGTINLAGANINKDGQFYNYGTINFSNHFNNSEYVYNEGIMNLAGNVNNNNGSGIDNYCTMNVAGNFSNNEVLNNYSYIQINGRLTCNNKGYLNMYDQALIETVDLTINEDVEGFGTDYSKIVISNNTTINNADVKGNIDLCDADGIETNNGDIEPSVTFCEASIPETYCNPGSNGSGGNSGGGDDADGDGVSDDFDEYPNDPDRAFNNYYPSEGNFGTLGFEDLWPYKGDYDFNDMVVDYNFNTVTNANDNAVETYVTLKVRAIGAAFKNGFGIQLPISPDAVAQVTGDFSLTQNLINLNAKNLENNQSNAVIIFFDNAFDLLPHPGDGTGVNTRNGATYVEPTEVNFHISFEYPVSSDNLGQAPFNPFIFVNGDRGREIHLKNHAPTDLVNSDLFGTGQDASAADQGLFYKTENNLPWAINIIEEFDYPVEKIAIINAYNYFGQWAESGGTQYTDWYTNASGYRNNTNIYTP